MKKKFILLMLSPLPLALSFPGALLFALCLPAEAQQTKKVPRIGLLVSSSSDSPRRDAFLQGLRDLGYVEGKNIAIEYR
jgi:putative tryptophan/tyrosine transport system substrate-binding protein